MTSSKSVVRRGGNAGGQASSGRCVCLGAAFRRPAPGDPVAEGALNHKVGTIGGAAHQKSATHRRLWMAMDARTGHLRAARQAEPARFMHMPEDQPLP